MTPHRLLLGTHGGRAGFWWPGLVAPGLAVILLAAALSGCGGRQEQSVQGVAVTGAEDVEVRTASTSVIWRTDTGVSDAFEAFSIVDITTPTAGLSAKVSFTVPSGVDPRLVVVATLRNGGEWQPLPSTVAKDGRHVIADLTATPERHGRSVAGHQARSRTSTWGAFSLDVGQFLAGMFGGTETPEGLEPLDCGNANTATVSVTGPASDPTLVACAGVVDGRQVVKVQNATPVAVSATRRAGVAATVTGIDGQSDRIVADFAAVTNNVVIPAYGNATLTPADPTAGFSMVFAPDPGAYLLEGLENGIGLIAATFGGSKEVAGALTSVSSVRNVLECAEKAGGAFAEAVGKCSRGLTEALLDLAKERGFDLPVVGIALALVDLSRLATDGIVGLIRNLEPPTLTYTPPTTVGGRTITSADGTGSMTGSEANSSDELPTTFDGLTTVADCQAFFVWNGSFAKEYKVQARVPRSGLRIYAARTKGLDPTSIPCAALSLGRQYRRLTASVAPADRDPTDVSSRLSILIDGRTVQTLHVSPGTLQNIDIDVSDAQELRFNVECVGRCDYYNVTTAGPVIFNEQLST